MLLGSYQSIVTFIVEVAPYWNVNLLAFGITVILLVVEVAPYWNVNPFTA